MLAVRFNCLTRILMYSDFLLLSFPSALTSACDQRPSFCLPSLSSFSAMHRIVVPSNSDFNEPYCENVLPSSSEKVVNPSSLNWLFKNFEMVVNLCTPSPSIFLYKFCTSTFSDSPLQWFYDTIKSCRINERSA